MWKSALAVEGAIDLEEGGSGGVPSLDQRPCSEEGCRVLVQITNGNEAPQNRPELAERLIRRAPDKAAGLAVVGLRRGGDAQPEMYWIVETQDGDRGPARRGQASDLRAFELEMVLPAVTARMEEGGDQAGLAVDS